MRYMLLMNHGSAPGVAPMSELAPGEMRAHGAAMMAIHEELVARGEFVGAEALVGPDGSKIVTHDGLGTPVVTDGPFPEAKEFLAGYWLIDVDSEARAIEIAAKTSAAPGARRAGGGEGDPGAARDDSVGPAGVVTARSSVEDLLRESTISRVGRPASCASETRWRSHALAERSMMRATLTNVARSLHVRLDETSAAALDVVRAGGLSDSEAVRTALREAAARRRVRSAIRREVQHLAADEGDREEMRLIREQLAELAPRPVD